MALFVLLLLNILMLWWFSPECGHCIRLVAIVCENTNRIHVRVSTWIEVPSIFKSLRRKQHTPSSPLERPSRIPWEMIFQFKLQERRKETSSTVAPCNTRPWQGPW
jgi:hypothetical protein